MHLLDDGFQHFQLMRDIDLLVAPPEDFADGLTLPFGRLREPLDAARRADALLVPASEQATPAEMSERLQAPRAFGFSRIIAKPKSIARAFAFAGIAKPERFYDDLERAGWQLTGRRSFPDHHPYSAREIDDLGRAARESGSELLVTTSKDLVRLAPRGAAAAQGVPILEVPLQISIDPAFQPWLQERLMATRSA